MSTLYTDPSSNITVALSCIAPGVYEVTQFDNDAGELIERSRFDTENKGWSMAMDRFDLIVSHF